MPPPPIPEYPERTWILFLLNWWTGFNFMFGHIQREEEELKKEVVMLPSPQDDFQSWPRGNKGQQWLRQLCGPWVWGGSLLSWRRVSGCDTLCHTLWQVISITEPSVRLPLCYGICKFKKGAFHSEAVWLDLFQTKKAELEIAWSPCSGSSWWASKFTVFLVSVIGYQPSLSLVMLCWLHVTSMLLPQS